MTRKQRTKRIFQTLFIMVSIGSLAFVPWILVKAALTPLPDTVQEQMDQAISNGFDGFIVYVDQAGKTPVSYAAGLHDRKNNIPARPKALFKMASIGKLYQAVSIAKLVNQGRLFLDKTLADYFPELAGRIENAEKITLKMMVQHRSGIPNYSDTPNFWSNPPESIQATLDLILDKPASFAPDEGYEYSNTNYLLIGELMDKILEHNSYQYLSDEVLIPLGLKNTISSLQEADLENVMSGYYVGIEDDLKPQEYGMLATAEDVGIFLRALNDGSLFKEGEQEIYSSIYEYDHTGWVPGYQSIAAYDKELDTVVILFANTTGGYNWDLLEIARRRIFKILRKSHGS